MKVQGGQSAVEVPFEGLRNVGGLLKKVKESQFSCFLRRTLISCVDFNWISGMRDIAQKEIVKPDLESISLQQLQLYESEVAKKEGREALRLSHLFFGQFIFLDLCFFLRHFGRVFH